MLKEHRISEAGNKIAEFFELLNLVCECGNLCDSIVEEGEIKLITTPSKYKIKNLRDWEKCISSDEKWIVSHEDDIMKHLSSSGTQMDTEDLDMILSLFDNDFIGSRFYQRIHKSKKTRIVAVTYECSDEKCGDDTPHYHRFIDE